MGTGGSSPALDSGARARESLAVVPRLVAAAVWVALIAGVETPPARADEPPAEAGPPIAARQATDAEEEYPRLALRYDLYQGHVVSVYQGAGYHPLWGVALYEAVDRPDLVRRQERLDTIRLVLAISGVGVAAGGLWFAYTRCHTKYYETHACDQGPAIATGFAVFALGVIAIPVAAATWNAADPEEVRAAVDEHNRRLRQRLGLAPAALPGGGGAVVTGRF
jgi:hypothetical protein